MTKAKNAWECECGAIAYAKLPPEECIKCTATESFTEVDEEEIDALADEHLIEQIRGRDWGEEDDSW